MLIRVFRHFVPVSTIILGVIEVTFLSLFWHFAASGVSINTVQPHSIIYSPSLIFAILAALIMMLSGLYQNRVFVNYTQLAVNVGISLIFITPMVIIGCFYWSEALNLNDSVWIFYLKMITSWLLCIALTRVAFSTLTDLNVFKRRVVVLGAGDKAARIAQIEKTERGSYFVTTAFVATGNDLPGSGGDTQKIVEDVIAGSNENDNHIVEIAHQFKAREIVIAVDDRRGLPVKQLLQCRINGIGVIDYLDFIERETKSVDISALSPGWLVFSDGFHGCGPVNIGKRCFDIVLSLCLLMFTLPVVLLTSLLIKLDSAGPVLYRQDRVGLGGKTFVLLKFRSMRTDAEKDGTPLWAGMGDPRVTRIGAIIRKLRIDELPQLLNVLYGDMSFVGPRPERPLFVDQFRETIPFYSERHCVKPGITGWAQTNYPYGASLADARNKLSYDLYYVKNYGLFLDLIIVVQTIRVVLSGSGAR